MRVDAQSSPTLCDPRLLCPWDSPGKDTGVGCRVLLQGIFPPQGSNLCLMSPALSGGFFIAGTTWEARLCYKVKVKWSCSVISNCLMTPWAVCSPPGFSVHGVSQARILEGIAISFSRAFSWPRDQTHVVHWQTDSSPLSHQGSSILVHMQNNYAYPTRNFCDIVVLNIVTYIFYFIIW